MPIGWWWHKIWCEVGYAIRRIIRTDKMYYRHLDQLCEYGFNLYGEKIHTATQWLHYMDAATMKKMEELWPKVHQELRNKEIEKRRNHRKGFGFYLKSKL